MKFAGRRNLVLLGVLVAAGAIALAGGVKLAQRPEDADDEGAEETSAPPAEKPAAAEEPALAAKPAPAPARGTGAKQGTAARLEAAAKLQRDGRYPEAVRAYQAILDAEPTSVEAHSNLAWLLATCPVDSVRDGAKAVRLATRACGLSRAKDGAAIDTLGVALAEAQFFTQAVDLLLRRREVADEAERERIDVRVALFRSGRTYQQAEAERQAELAGKGTDDMRHETRELLRAAVALEQSGRLADAVEAYKKAAARAKEAWGSDHMETSEVLLRLARVCLAVGQFETAAPHYAQALRNLRQRLPKGNDVLLSAIHEYAIVLGKCGRHEEAVALHEEIWKDREAALGKNHSEVLLAMQYLAMEYYSMGRYQEAIPMFHGWIERNQRGQGNENPSAALVQTCLGECYLRLRIVPLADEALGRALQLAQTKTGMDLQQMARISADMASLYGMAEPPGRDKVKQWTQRCLQALRALPSANAPDIAVLLLQLGLTHQTVRNFPEAVTLLSNGLGLSEAVYGKNSIEAAVMRIQLADIYAETGQYAEAERLCQAALAVLEAKAGEAGSARGLESALPLLADIANRTNQQAGADARLRKFLAQVETRAGKDNPLLANVSVAAGQAYLKLGLPDQARQQFQRALMLRRAWLGPDHLAVADVLQQLGTLCVLLAKYAEAESDFTECMRIRRDTLGMEHILVASSLCDLGVVCYRTGRYEEAEQSFRRALIITDRLGPAAAPVRELVLAHWGRLSTELGHGEDAESLLKQGLATAQQRDGPRSIGVAWVLVSLGQLYYGRGRYAAAEPLFRQSLEIFDAIRGKDHPDSQVALADLGATVFALGRDEEAERILRQCLKTFETGREANDRNRMATLERLSEVCLHRGQLEEGLRRLTESRQVSRKWRTEVLPALGPAEQMAYLFAGEKPEMAAALSIGLRYAGRTPAAEASAEWVLNGKATGAEFLAEQIQLARQSDDPTVGDTMRQLTEVREQLARMVLNPQPGSVASGRAEEAALYKKQRDLARKLGLRTRIASRSDRWVTLAEVRSAIPRDAALIEIARFPVFRTGNDGHSAWEPERYVAWVIPPAGTGEVRLVDLGPAGPIDTAVARARFWVALFPEAVGKVGMLRATGEATAATADLATRVWKPLAAAVAGASSLFVSPDGGLWLYPWEALPMGDGKFLVEQKQISYLMTGRAIVPGGEQKRGAGAVIFSDPDYDQEPPDAPANPLAGWPAMIRQWLESDKRGGLLAGAKFVRLGGENAMAEITAASLQRYVKSPASVYQGKDATEKTFKGMHSPRVLVVSTHGYFMPDQIFDRMPLTAQARHAWAVVNAWRLFGPARGSMRFVPDPLLRCGLALTGANNYYRARGADDGVLTGMEILATDLRGTELVFLRACESGLGAVQESEGAIGLRHAFQLAGARTVIAGLWRLPATPSNRLMEGFFGNLAAGQSPPAALRNAQVSIIRQLTKVTGSAHPALWAGFTLTGDWR